MLETTIFFTLAVVAALLGHFFTGAAIVTLIALSRSPKRSVALGAAGSVLGMLLCGSVVYAIGVRSGARVLWTPEIARIAVPVTTWHLIAPVAGLLAVLVLILWLVAASRNSATPS